MSEHRLRWDELPSRVRAEVDATRRLPAEVPAPRLLHAYDDGDWVVGVFEYVDGHMPGNPVVAAYAGFLAERGRRPDPPGLPTVRAFQRAQGEVVLRWLRTGLGDLAPQ